MNLSKISPELSSGEVFCGKFDIFLKSERFILSKDRCFLYPDGDGCEKMIVTLNRKKLCVRRREKALTQEELAEESDLSDRYIRSLESEKLYSQVQGSMVRVCK